MRILIGILLYVIFGICMALCFKDLSDDAYSIGKYISIAATWLIGVTIMAFEILIVEYTHKVYEQQCNEEDD